MPVRYISGRFPLKSTIAALLLLTLLISVKPIIAESHVERVVKAQGTLTAIVNKNYIDAKSTNSQIMVGILATNPDAFVGGNINYMVAGADLKLPPDSLIQNISPTNANTLLEQHYYYFRRGRTGDLPPPSLKALRDPAKMDDLLKENEKKEKALQALNTERDALKERLEKLEQDNSEKTRQTRVLERQIRDLEDSKSLVGSSISNLKLQMDSGELSGEGSELLKELEARNRNLNSQLQTARSEAAESTQLEVSMERRLTDSQSRAKQLAEALRERGVEPESVVTTEADSNNIPRPTIVNESKPSTSQAMASGDTADAGSTGASSSESPDAGANDDSAAGKASSSKPMAKWMPWAIITAAIIGFLWLLSVLLEKFGRRRSSRSGDRQDSYEYRKGPPVSEEFAEMRKSMEPVVEVSEEEPLAVGIKLDVAQAYLEADNIPAAQQMLSEVIAEGGNEQRQTAQLIMQSING